MRARIKGDGERPMLFALSTCRDFIRTVPARSHDSTGPRILTPIQKTTFPTRRGMRACRPNRFPYGSSRSRMLTPSLLASR